MAAGMKGLAPSLEEAVNAATMMPGVLLAMRRFNQLAGGSVSASRRRRLATAGFVYLCASSMMYHLVADGPLKPAALRVDLVTQQIVALATAAVTHGRRPWAALCGIAAMSVASARMPASSTAAVVLQAAIALVANGFHLGRWWLAALALRMWGVLMPNRWTHGLFHLAVLKAFDGMWASWVPRRAAI